MKKISCVIVDDDPACVRELEYLLTAFAQKLEIVGIANNAKDALALIKKTKPELLFLDIQIGETDIFEVLSQIPIQDFKIIFATAHDKYILEALRLSAVDYLLKPVQEEELSFAINKFQKERLFPAKLVENINTLNFNINHSNKLKKIGIPTKKGYVVKEIKDLIYVEAFSNYSKFYFKNNINYTMSRTLADVEDMVNQFGFFRVHKTYLINLSYIDFFDTENLTVLLDTGQSVPVSIRRKSELLDVLKSVF